MIQRIQTLYLALAFLLSGILSFVFPLWTEGTAKFFARQNSLYSIAFALIAALSVYSILLFKKRQTQFVLNRLNIILNLILLGLFIYRSLNLSGEAVAVSEKGIGMFLPLGVIVLLVFANKSIKSDEDLVKSVDRLR